MHTYKIDWKDVVHGSYEIEASSSGEALEKFKSLLKKELYEKSKWDTDGKELKVKLVGQDWKTVAYWALPIYWVIILLATFSQ